MLLYGTPVCQSCRASFLQSGPRSLASRQIVRKLSSKQLPLYSALQHQRLVGRHSRSHLRPGVIPSVVRFQSTASSSASQNISPSAFIDTTEVSDNFPTATASFESKLAEPLKELGYLRNGYDLDFGWGPTSLAQWVFEHLHVYMDSDMWVSLMATAVLFRVAMLPLLIRTTENSARLSHLRPLVNELMEKVKVAAAKGQTDMVQLHNMQRRALLKEHGINPFLPFLNLVQIPLSFGYFRLFRNMIHIPVAGMTTGGVLWFQDLTLRDPYFMLPLFLGLTQYVQMRHSLSRQTPPGENIAQFQKYLTYGLPMLGMFVVSFQASTLAFYFACSSSLGLAQHFLLYSNRFRCLTGMTPFANVDSSSLREPKSPYKGTITTTATVSKSAPRTDQASKTDFSSSGTATDTPRGLITKLKASMSNGLDNISKAMPGSGGQKGWKDKEKQRIRKAKAQQHEKKRSEEYQREKAEYEAWTAEKHRPGRR